MDLSRLQDESPTVLDCTFRDGGYYTEWHFDDALVQDYIAAMSESRVAVLEAGYVAPKATGCGRFKVDRLDKFDFLPRLSGRRWAVMMDSKSFLAHDGWQQAVRDALPQARETVIDVVRIAAHYTDVGRLPALVDEIARLGYRPVLNLMQIDNAGDVQALELFDALAAIDGLDAVYLADSFGSMTPGRVTALVRALGARCSRPIGFHSHDNMGLALVNSLAAIAAGASWIDSTVAGMGRGAGNTATEELCLLLDGDVNPGFDRLLERHFAALKERYGWGRNVLYRIAGQRRLHPMYVQALGMTPALGADALARVVRAIPDNRASAFDPVVLEGALNAA